MILRQISGHPSAWQFPENIKKTKQRFEKPKVADIVPDSVLDAPKSMDTVIGNLSRLAIVALAVHYTYKIRNWKL